MHWDKLYENCNFSAGEITDVVWPGNSLGCPQEELESVAREKPAATGREGGIDGYFLLLV